MIDLNEMAIFTKVVEAKSFTKAGIELEMPKSSISRRISRLEERLGVRLIQRTTRSLNLTDAGNTYFIHCSRIVNQAKEADMLATSNQTSLSGVIRITAPPGLTVMPKLIAEFMSENDQVQIEYRAQRSIVNLVAEEFDVAIRVGKLVDSTMIARLLGGSKLRLCASPDYILKNGAPETFEDLQYHSLIQGIPWHVADDSGNLPVDLPKRVITNENFMAKELALKGLGIAVLSVIDCNKELKAGTLKHILCDHPLPEKNIYLVYPSNRYLSIKVSTFIDFILNRWKELKLLEG